jgi:hypothetical protein
MTSCACAHLGLRSYSYAWRHISSARLPYSIDTKDVITSKRCFKHKTVKSIVRWNGLWSSKSSFPFGSSLAVPWWSSQRLHELRKEVELFLIDKKSDPSHYLQDNKWVARLSYLSDIFSYINQLTLKFEGPVTTMFNAWNKTEYFKYKLKLCLNMIAEGNNECFSRTQILLWKQVTSFDTIQFQIL